MMNRRGNLKALALASAMAAGTLSFSLQAQATASINEALARGTAQIEAHMVLVRAEIVTQVARNRDQHRRQIAELRAQQAMHKKRYTAWLAAQAAAMAPVAQALTKFSTRLSALPPRSALLLPPAEPPTAPVWVPGVALMLVPPTLQSMAAGIGGGTVGNKPAPKPRAPSKKGIDCPSCHVTA